MGTLDGSGALGEMQIIANPVGTLDEIKQAGLDPSAVACCAPSGDAPNAIRGVRGCNAYNECPFHMKKFNHGKWTRGEGPRYVGYRLFTVEGHKAENDMRCFDFVRTMLKRMRVGQQEREEGRVGEIIRIVAQEGEMIRTRVGVKDEKDPKGLTYRNEIKLRPVHTFQRPKDMDTVSYDGALRKSEIDAQKRDAELADQWDAEPVKYDEKDDDWSKDDAVLDLPAPSGATPIAAPVTPKAKP